MLVAIPLFDRFTALDAVGPYEVLCRLPGTEIVFVGEKTGPVRTDTGMLAITVDRHLDEIDAPDVVVVPGGRGPARTGRRRGARPHGPGRPAAGPARPGGRPAGH